MGALRTYGDLARELKLSPAQTNQLMDLIAGHEQPSSGPALGPNPPDPAALRQRFDEMQEKKEQAIADLLGPQKAAQSRAYQESLGQRMELRMMRDHFDVLGIPLAGDQEEKLLSILIEEGRRAAAPTLGPDSGEQDFEQMRQSYAQSQQRVRERAALVLDPDQRDQLEEYCAMRAPPLTLAGAGGATPRAARAQ